MARLRLTLFLTIAAFVLVVGGQNLTVVAQSPTLDDEVPFVDPEGNTLGAIAVTEISDPATGLDPAAAPEAGSRFVTLTLRITAADDQRFEIDPFDIIIQDDTGIAWTRTSVNLADDALIPELTSQTLAPGSRVSGIVGFVLPDASDVASVLYQPETNRIVTLAEAVPTDPPALGETVPIVDGNEGSGELTVLDVVDSFTGFDPSSSPDSGSRYVMIQLELENTSSGLLEASASDFILRDDSGYLWSSTSVQRPVAEAGAAGTPVILDLNNQMMAPGDRITRVVFFALPADALATELYLQPATSQLVAIANFGSADDATPVASDD